MNKITFWNLIEKYVIKIPIMQRDYVQGRENEREIAHNFIDSLYNSLFDDKQVNLDFIYGKADQNSRLTPIDGQQRLTTLWLLHWYIATKEKVLDEEIKKILLRFNYETRLTSQDFCKNLIEKGINQFSNDKKVSEKIRDQNWYRLTWELDPTVKNMLNMLDIIHNKFKETNNLWGKLISENCPITFYFLEMKEFALTDELYIKMNARGKPITEFEYFKAKFAELLDDANKHKLDNEWLNNIFWKNNAKKVEESEISIDDIEKYFFNFFENLILLFFVESDKVDNIDKNFIDSYNLLHLFDAEIKKDENDKFIFTNNNVERIIKFLNYFENDNNIDEISMIYFDNFIKKSHKEINYPERVKFYSLLLYIDNNSYDNNNVKSRWLRVTRNLINNARIDEPSDFLKAIKSLKNLVNIIENLYEKLSQDKINITFFYKEQVEEEKLKCKLILQDNENNERWEDLILDAENFPYFDGQIGFILELSKDENSHYIKENFIKYYQKLKLIFEKLKNNSEFLFERALLTQGNYLVSKGRNYTFCNYNESIRDKLENWRKVFNDENKRIILKNLLDNIKDESIDNIEKLEFELKIIIDTYLHKNYENPEDWRYFFIKNPRLLEYCKLRQLRFEYREQINNNFPLIYLLSRQKMNSEHAELYTYDLYLYLKDKIINNIDYEHSQSYDMPKIVIKKDEDLKYITTEKGKLIFLGKEYEVYEHDNILIAIKEYLNIN